MIDISIFINVLENHKLSEDSMYIGSIIAINDDLVAFINVDCWPLSKIKGYLFGKEYECLLMAVIEEFSKKDRQMFYSTDNGDIFKIESTNRSKIVQFPIGGDADG